MFGVPLIKQPRCRIVCFLPVDFMAFQWRAILLIAQGLKGIREALCFSQGNA